MDWRHVMQFRRGLILRTALLAIAMAMFAPAEVDAIPAFARKYRVTCALCHAPFPRLNAFGEEFAGNGFQMVRGETPRDTMYVADPLLRLQQDIPLAVRVDAYMSALSSTDDLDAGGDLKMPWGVKLLSGGQITESVSYYFYFYMSERGEVAGLEDAYLQFNDVFGSGFDVMAGQFQVSDPMMKRELRLSFEDYQPYRVRVGDVRADLTYERGLMASYSPWADGDLVLQLVNGHGLEEANAEKAYDADLGKNVGVRFSQDLGIARLGGSYYGGTEAAGGLESSLAIWGADATIPLGNRITFNGQFLLRQDGNPFFLDSCGATEFRCNAGVSDPFETEVTSFMGEFFVSPDGAMGKWHFTVLYNLIESDQQVFRLRLGEQNRGVGYMDAYETLSFGTHYFKARNLRFMGEIGWDFVSERARFTTGVTTAF
jgi:hypothetical protein